jgi:ATP-dependent DNA helicase UvrD/PcrA
MNWSSEQQAIFDYFKSGKGNLVVEALAGTGKTTTMGHGLGCAPERRKLYGVFNKRNELEAQEKLSRIPNLEIRTWHSVGNMFIKKIWPNAKVDIHDPNEIEFDRAENVLRPHGLHDDKLLVGSIVKLVGFVKNTFINPSQGDIYETAIEREIIDGSKLTDKIIVNSCAHVLELSKEQDPENRISFNDMVWLPCAMGIVKPTFDLVVGDEAQDLNMPQLEMMKRCCKSTGRICVVGDSRQAIYAFRGAVHQAMRKMQLELNAAVLTLSVTYRCPQSVVMLAKEIVPKYTAAPEAPQGEVIHCKNAEEVAQVGDAILSRLNAPLMPLALYFLRKNIPTRIEGRDIGKQLIARVRSFKASSVPNFLDRVMTWETKEISRLEKTKNPEKKMEQTRDIAETLRALAMDAKNIADIDARINYLFQDSNSSSKPCILLSSVHKAKGLEWHRVLLLQSTFRNGKGNMEEDNIYYVAVTRSKHTLIYISDSAPQWKLLCLSRCFPNAHPGSPPLHLARQLFIPNAM